MFIFVIIGLAYLPLQIAAWKKWTGPWFYWSLVLAVIPISGCAIGLVKNSNLWPFGGVFLFPYSLLTLSIAQRQLTTPHTWGGLTVLVRRSPKWVASEKEDAFAFAHTANCRIFFVWLL
ncbi:MAG: hypothetical protein WCG63_13100 [Opitutaceae bacterium]